MTSSVQLEAEIAQALGERPGSVTRFRVDAGGQPSRTFDDASEALTYGARRAYLSPSDTPRMLERLERDEPATWTYGFTSVTITPLRDTGKPRDELVRVAHSAAALVFVGKPKLTDATIKKAKAKAFEAIRRHDRIAGTGHHSHAAHSHDIAALAAEGVEQAIAGWRDVQGAGGAAGIKRRHGIR